MSTENKVFIYDTTLRDGAQAEGVTFSPVAKIHVAKMLDSFGVDYIEGGYAASNPKDMAFFKDIKKEKLKHAKVAAFGSTRRANTPVEQDKGTLALLEADTEVCTIFGKTWLLHVTEVLKTTPEENLAMIEDTCRFLKENGKEVVYDAEHFFDGYKDSPEYALQSLEAATKGGADVLVLCDTNGGCLPHEVFEITALIREKFDVAVGIHTHNDSETAVANAMESVRAGAVQVQGVINGFGERCGNCNLISVAANVTMKTDKTCLADPEQLKNLKKLSLFVNEQAKLRNNKRAAFVGDSAFAHKAGMHVDGVRKVSHSFEHVPPESVGNSRRILISELSGASNVMEKLLEMGLDNIDRKSPEVREILQTMEKMEKSGYVYESADASFKMLIKKVLKEHKSFFELDGFRVIIEKRGKNEPCISEASLKLKVNGEKAFTVGEGDGPVDALNMALRRALHKFYPGIDGVYLADYRVSILDPEEATAAKTRVVIESSDGDSSWSTVGVSENIIEASWEALVDGVEYKLFLNEEKAD
ncbi:citramalate synthase [Pontiella sulfatireligans]|uniref:Citramalate synthase n=1 Tax=Pontiella sulfatireligans TaxID=2750658 RepID=A0A6C2UM48_9BACT|nr:citramalate synthase [Pontiella sulfatireligans]VGO21198.1 (R)-citramalate synthase [Pontiella sulfatireligans]